MKYSASFSLYKYLAASSKNQTEIHLGHLKTTLHMLHMKDSPPHKKTPDLIFDLIRASPKQLS